LCPYRKSCPVSCDLRPQRMILLRKGRLTSLRCTMPPFSPVKQKSLCNKFFFSPVNTKSGQKKISFLFDGAYANEGAWFTAVKPPLAKGGIMRRIVRHNTGATPARETTQYHEDQRRREGSSHYQYRQSANFPDPLPGLGDPRFESKAQEHDSRVK
jgi:hypothetical protein